jgi:hypothetical protein
MQQFFVFPQVINPVVRVERRVSGHSPRSCSNGHRLLVAGVKTLFNSIHFPKPESHLESRAQVLGAAILFQCWAYDWTSDRPPRADTRCLTQEECGATTLRNSLELIILVLFQKLGKWRWLPVIK